MPIGPLFSVFCLLASGSRAMSSGNVFLLLGFGFYFVVFFARTATSAKRDAIFQDTLKIVFFTHNPILMVEQSYTSKGHSNTIFVASHDDMIIANGTASLGNKLDATLMGTLNVITEGEESIRT